MLCSFLLHNKVNQLLLFSCSVMSDSLQPHGLQHARLPCPSLSPWVYSNSCPLSWWCHPTTSSSVVPFSSFLPLSPASGSCPTSQLFTSDGQSIRASAPASVLPLNIQDWAPLELTGLISLYSMGLSRVFSNTTFWKHQFFGAQPSLWSSSHICTWLLEKSIVYTYTYILSLLDFLPIQHFAKKRLRGYLKELSGLKPQSLL